jgi:hypothetical protein
MRWQWWISVWVCTTALTALDLATRVVIGSIVVTPMSGRIETNFVFLIAGAMGTVPVIGAAWLGSKLIQKIWSDD